jgi:N-acylneuraminate cytidylyltransferase
MRIAVIPARGGSKRIPKKNIKKFHGIPMISYAIKAAQESEIFDAIYVSTDDEEIKEIAVSFGAEVPWIRKAELSDDYATTVGVMQDAVRNLKSIIVNSDLVCCIYATTPFLKPIFLAQGLQIIQEENWDYVLSASRADTPPERFFSLEEGNRVELLFPEHELTRTQDLPIRYRDAGQFYWGREACWESGLPIFSSKSTIVEIPRELALDIDTPEDWDYASHLFAMQRIKLK